jgi:hypothetical protein
MDVDKYWNCGGQTSRFWINTSIVDDSFMIEENKDVDLVHQDT